MRRAYLGWMLAIITLFTVEAAAQPIPLSVPLSSRGFERVGSRRGVDVYVHRGGEVTRFAAEGRFAARPETVRRALLDYRTQIGRIRHLAEARVLRRGPSSLVVYQRLGLPVISDRDYTLDVRWGSSGSMLWITQRVTPEGPAPRRGVVRVTRLDGSWLLQPSARSGDTFARYETTIDMGGRMPAAKARSGTARELPDLFDDVAGMLAER